MDSLIDLFNSIVNEWWARLGVLVAVIGLLLRFVQTRAAERVADETRKARLDAGAPNVIIFPGTRIVA